MPSNPSNDEQLLLELINRFRTNPGGEAALLIGANAAPGVASNLSYFGVNLGAFQAQLAALTPIAPLAWNGNLADAADGHNAAMVAADEQTHQAPGEPGLGQRVTNAGYTNWSALGENVFAFSDSVIFAHAAFVIDWGFDAEDIVNGVVSSNFRNLGDGMQDPAGHRISMMNPAYTEIGLSVIAETNPSTQVGPQLITEDLGNRFGYQAQFVGVVIDDQDGDQFYDVGEGRGGVTVTFQGATQTFTTTTWTSGGYQLAVPAGNYTITFSGGGLLAPVAKQAVLGGSNVKVDAIAPDVPMPEPVPPNRMTGTSGADAMTGTDGVDIIDGREGDDTLNGGLSADVLIGGAGNDVLIGGPGAANELYGGAGNDVYFVDTPTGDSIVELPGEGTDQVRTALTNYVLAANIEQLVYTGSGAFNGIGGGGANLIVGGSGANTLNGGGGDDVLVGGGSADILIGGSGSNELQGGLGNDVYFVGATGDSIVEAAGGGIDQVRTDAAAYTLPAQVEQLVYIGLAGFAGSGSAGADLIVGGAGADTLNGLGGNDELVGGAGDDILIGGTGLNTMNGGAGRDVYFVTNTGDSVIEAASQGTDQVRTDAASYTLTSNVEELVFTGAGAFRGEGNALANLISGGSGADVLLGGGGDDALSGGAGADLLEGGDGADTLGGGLGADTLNGQAGADFLLFEAALGGGNIDLVQTFSTGADRILLDRSVFGAIGAGALSANAFVRGTAAQDADDRILYDQATGALRYDADGSGAGAAVQFATLQGGVDLAATDILGIGGGTQSGQSLAAEPILYAMAMDYFALA